MINISLPIAPLNKRLKKLTEDCITALNDNTVNDFHVELIINGGDYEWIPAVLPKSYKITTEKSLMGNAKAWNAGIRVPYDDYICFMDNDVIVSPNWDVHLTKALEDEKYGIAIPQNIKKAHIGNVGTMEVMDTDMQGCCIFVARRCLDKIGGFDEYFNPAFFEDTDFFIRALEAGFKRIGVPESEITHYSGQTTFHTLDMTKVFNSNYEKCINKHGPYFWEKTEERRMSDGEFIRPSVKTEVLNA